MPFEGELRPFQQRARDQILEWGRGIVGVTMGGGKTPIAIAITEELLDREEVECGLIIAPSSLKYQWRGKPGTKNPGGLAQFAPGANVVVIDGNADQRRELYMHAMGWAEYIILGYPQVIDDWKFVKKLPAGFIVLDEIQAIKNPGSQRSQKIEKLLFPARKRGKMILGLTGQLLENKPEDVFHVCAGVDPHVLGHPEVFDMTFVVRDKYGKPTRYVNPLLLKKRLHENILVRVSRDEIEEYLPNRTHEQFLVPFDESTRKLYRTVVTDLHEELSQVSSARAFDLVAHYSGAKTSAAEAAQRGRVMSRLTCARMLCDDPRLLLYSADLYNATASGELGAVKAGSAYAYELRERGLLDGIPRGRGVKMREVVDEVRTILSEDPANKVVVFSTFKPVLFWLQAALKRYSKVVVYHGGVTAKRRDELKVQFNNDDATRVFLSSDAGGAGVDLPAGNYLINYNLPFSAGLVEQRNARIDRMSSEHTNTMVLDFFMEGSVEEFYAEIVAARARLARAAIDGAGRGRGGVSLPTTSLRGFLEDWLEANPVIG